MTNVKIQEKLFLEHVVKEAERVAESVRNSVLNLLTSVEQIQIVESKLGDIPV